MCCAYGIFLFQYYQILRIESWIYTSPWQRCGPDSLVDITTGYGLVGPGIELNLLRASEKEGSERSKVSLLNGKWKAFKRASAEWKDSVAVSVCEGEICKRKRGWTIKHGSVYIWLCQPKDQSLWHPRMNPWHPTDPRKDGEHVPDRRPETASLHKTGGHAFLLRDLWWNAEYRHNNGEISIMSTAMAGMGTKKIRIANLPPEEPDESLRSNLTQYGKVVTMLDEMWSRT